MSMDQLAIGDHGVSQPCPLPSLSMLHSESSVHAMLNLKAGNGPGDEATVCRVDVLCGTQ